VAIFGMGLTEQEIYNDYGLTVNMFTGLMEEIEENDMLSMIYMLHSEELTGSTMTK